MMVKEIIQTNQRQVTLKYDEDTYEIEYIKKGNIFLLRRLIDHKVLHIFPDDIGFIVQHDEKDRISFVVSEYDKKKNSAVLNHYVSDKYGDYYIRLSIECPSLYLSDCFVSKNSYIVEVAGKKHIYNLHLGSEPFSKIYVDDRIQNLLGQNVVMVSQEKENDIIKDTITYGINPDTFEIVTSIWSELQQRYIDVYTKEQVDKIDLANRTWNSSCTDNGRITIYLEIERYLEQLASYLQQSKSIYLDEYEGFKKKINQEFVKSFVKK